MEVRVAAGEVVAGGAEEVEGPMMISTAAVTIMDVKIAIIEVEVVVMMMVAVGEEGAVGVVVITTDMMVTVADMADPQVEGTETDLSVLVDHLGMAFLLPYHRVVLRCVRYPFLTEESTDR